MDLIFKVAGIGIIVIIISELLERSGKKDLSNFVSLAGTITVLIILSNEIWQLFELLKKLFK